MTTNEQEKRRESLEDCICNGTGIEYNFDWWEYPATDTVKLEIVHPNSFVESDFTVRFKFRDCEIPTLAIDITDNRNKKVASTILVSGQEIYQPATIYGILHHTLNQKVW